MLMIIYAIIFDFLLPVGLAIGCYAAAMRAYNDYARSRKQKALFYALSAVLGVGYLARVWLLLLAWDLTPLLPSVFLPFYAITLMSLKTDPDMFYGISGFQKYRQPYPVLTAAWALSTLGIIACMVLRRDAVPLGTWTLLSILLFFAFWCCVRLSVPVSATGCIIFLVLSIFAFVTWSEEDRATRAGAQQQLTAQLLASKPLPAFDGTTPLDVAHPTEGARYLVLEATQELIGASLAFDPDAAALTKADPRAGGVTLSPETIDALAQSLDTIYILLPFSLGTKEVITQTPVLTSTRNIDLTGWHLLSFCTQHQAYTVEYTYTPAFRSTYASESDYLADAQPFTQIKDTLYQYIHNQNAG